MPDTSISVLLALLDQAFDHRAWHGTNLRGSVRGLSAADASWRPAPKRHNIWEVTVHTAYWKYVARRRLLSETKGSFPLKGSNWFKRPAGKPNEAAWKSDVALLIETHRRLREAVAGMSAGSLDHKPPDSKVTNLTLLMGIASHDLYHAGQIQLLKKLRRAR